MLIVVLLLKMHFIDDKYLAGVRTCRQVLALTHCLRGRDFAENENKIYNQYKTRIMYEVEGVIGRSGLQVIKSDGISGELSIEKVSQIMFERTPNQQTLTEFGRYHFRQFKCLPIIFGEISAIKP